jgi:UrcA family protein
MKRFVALLALTAGLSAPVLALAQPYGEAAEAFAITDPEAVHVTTRGLDLSQPHDAAVMLKRISQAALQACGASDFSFPDYRRSVLNSACYHAGVDHAVRQLDAPGLNALYGQLDTVKLAAN